MMRGLSRGRMLVVAGALVLGAGFTAPSIASAALEMDSTQCGRRTVVGIDDKICPSTRRRPAVVIHRACCANAKGKVKCKRFPKCPRRSPS
jgi:hypothetical protein